jgi:hypothetical protein
VVAARIPYKTAVAGYNRGLRTWKARIEPDIRSGNLSAVKSDDSNFRDVVFNFDGKLRKISFPDSAKPSLTLMLEANRSLIGDLDSQGSASSPEEFDRFTPRLNASIRRVRTASKRVAKDLGIK